RRPRGQSAGPDHEAGRKSRRREGRGRRERHQGHKGNKGHKGTEAGRRRPEMSEEHWTARHGKPIIFVILTLVAVGVYLASTIPVAVFPEVDFPRIVVGIDNGVAPIDQMLVTVTRPIEEAVNTVQGLERVQSITSRGSNEIDLFFSWRVDMFQTLERVNAALARVQAEVRATAKLRADRLTFA